MRYFNTTGPCRADQHYMLPAEPRLPEAPKLIDRGQYFAVHAPRQVGKTTTLMALARSLTAQGKFAALHFSCETGEPAGDDYTAAQEAVLSQIARSAELALPDELRPPSPWPPDAVGAELLTTALSAWSRACPRQLVLFFDEIDALRGNSLRAVLRQLRSGFPSRPEAFPHSVVLCGLRDVRDYKAASGGDPTRLGTSSPFNIKVASLRLADFSEDDLRDLYAQHTDATGQPFEEAALECAWELSRGQPWLVNSLGREVVEELGLEPSQAITRDHMEEAKERLILARATHLDSLVKRLNEDRVRRVLEPVIAGAYTGAGDSYNDDISYVRDLGLLASTAPARVANPIYREVIVRVLSAFAEDRLPVEDPRTFILPDGTLDLRRILEEFAEFWREHGEVLAAGMPYHEVAPQLVIMAYLQRIVNGGGYVDREYGVGRGRIDLLLRWPYEKQGKRHWQREALELKVWRDGEKDPLSKGLAQLDGYLDRLGLDTGVLVIFDRRSAAAPIEERTVFEEATSPAGRSVTLLKG